MVYDSASSIAVDARGHIWIGTDVAGASELIPSTRRFPMPPTPTATATIPPAVPPETSTALPPAPPTKAPEPPTATAVPAATPQVEPQGPATIFARIWEDVYEGMRDGMQWALGPARQIWCADQRFEHGLMLWRNNDAQPGTVYVLMYGAAGNDAGTWQSFPDTFQAGEPESGNFAPPPDRFEPVRGFGKVWRERLGDGSTPPPIGWAIEKEQGSDQAQYQDFRGGTMFYSPHLNQILVLKSDGSWRAFPASQ
jgi:hypothetical protein